MCRRWIMGICLDTGNFVLYSLISVRNYSLPFMLTKCSFPIPISRTYLFPSKNQAVIRPRLLDPSWQVLASKPGYSFLKISRAQNIITKQSEDVASWFLNKSFRKAFESAQKVLHHQFLSEACSDQLLLIPSIHWWWQSSVYSFINSCTNLLTKNSRRRHKITVLVRINHQV